MNFSFGDDHNSIPASLSKAVLTMQIISIALLFGAVNVAVIMVALTMTSDDAVLTTDFEPFVIAVLGISFVTVTASFVLPPVFRNLAFSEARRAASLRDDANSPIMDPNATLSEPEAKMLGFYQTAHIVGSAVLEGTSLIASIGFLLTSNVICLGIAILTIMLLAGRFATMGKVSGWMEEMIRRAA